MAIGTSKKINVQDRKSFNLGREEQIFPNAKIYNGNSFKYSIFKWFWRIVMVHTLQVGDILDISYRFR